MRKLIYGLTAVLGVVSGIALAQNPGPAESGVQQQYYLGPSLGNLYRAADSYISGTNAQTGTSYTMNRSDRGKLVTFNNANPVAVTQPQANTAGFGPYECYSILNLGAGTVTVTPTTSTINGGATKTYAQGTGGRICSDGTNFFAF